MEMSDSFESESLGRLAMSEDDLLALLGTDLAGPQALPLRPSELVERGRRWLTAQHVYLEEHVCSSESVKQFALTTNDNVAIAVELARLLAGLILPVNPVTLAVLLTKKGLKTFCSTRWEAK
jgi:hypothetical protein